MKEKIHPKYYPDAKVVCACGSTFTVGSTKPEIRTDVCSACHPFFTGEQRIVDTAGQVDRFIRRLERKTEIQDEAEKLSAVQKKARVKRPKAIALVEESPEESQA